MNRRAIVGFLCCPSICFLAACEQQPGEPSAIAVQVRELVPESVQTSIRFSATVRARQTVELTFKVPGTVDHLHRVKTATGERDVHEGDVLSKGTVIAQLELRDYEREVERAKAEVDLATANLERADVNVTKWRREYDRVRGFFEQGTAPKKELDDVTTARDVAEADLTAAKNSRSAAEVALRQAQDRFADCTLRVPIDNATVVMKAVEPGERVAAQRVVFRIMDISTVYVDFGVPDTMLGVPATGTEATVRIALGQELDIVSDAFEGRKFSGRITKISPAADPSTRTFLTEVTLENPEGLIKPGMIATVRLGQEKKAVLLPMTAIQRGRTPGEMIVYKIEEQNGKSVARRKRVDLGGVYNNQVEVKQEGSEIRVGDRAVVTGAWRLDEGTEVLVLDEKRETVLR